MFSFTIHDLLEKNFAERADKPALILGDSQLSYGDMARKTMAIAAWLHEIGIRRRDRIGIHLHKSIEETVATFAVARAGAVFVNVSYQRTVQQLRHIVEDCGVRVLFTDHRRAELIRTTGLIDLIERIVVVGKRPDHPKMMSWDDLPSSGTAPECRPVDADLAALLYTSGSTGKPKGVMITHLNFVEGTRRVADYLKNTSDDRILGLVSLGAPWGMIQVTSMFLVGGSVVLQPVAIPAEIVKTLVSGRVTGMAAFPETWIQIVGYLQEIPMPMPALRYITSSGGKIPRPTLEALPKVFPGVEIFLTYGLTEAFRSTYLPPELYAKKMGSFGCPCRNVDVFIVDPDKGICGPGEQGELLHRGSLVTQGYWGNPEATAERIRVCEHLRPIIGDEKVHYSGDIVRIDEDGYFWFVGRDDTMIKCSGHRISPTEVEEVVYESGFAESVVAFGVEDEALGQVVHIAVSQSKKPLDIEALRHYLQRNMPTYMVPRMIHPWDGEMPQTSNSKIDRVAVIAACKSRQEMETGSRPTWR